ncbi:MAG TPA: tetratricopeptide repeat protein [Bacilli bacterium]|nr:tetratricopeptide repeat protein [Bacilli bacterium]
MQVANGQVQTLDALEQQLAKLEQQVQANPETVLEQVGEQLAGWELLVRQHAAYSLGLRIGELLFETKQLWLALSWFHWVVSSEVTEPDIATRAKALRQKGRIYIFLGMSETALPIFEEAEELFRTSGAMETREYSVLLQNHAVALVRTRQYEAALDVSKRALPQLIAHGDLNSAARVSATMGSCLRITNQYEEALDSFIQARDWLETTQDYLHLGRVWHNYAELMRDWGRVEEAIAAWLMSLEMKKRTHDHTGQVNTLLSMAGYLMSQAEYHSAWKYVSQAIALCHQYQLREAEIRCLDKWSEILIALSRYADLEVCATRAAHLANIGFGKDRVKAMIGKIAEHCRQVGLEQQAAQYNTIAVQIID